MVHHKIVLIVSLSLFPLKTAAQTAEVDSLLRQLPLVKDTLKVTVLNQLSRQHWFSDPKKTIRYARQAIKLSEELAFKNGVCRAYHNLGVGYYLQNDYPNALLNFGNAVAKNEETGNRKGMGDALNNIGLVYWKQSNYPKAVDYYLKGLQIDEERKDEKGIAMSLDNIGNVYNDQGDYPAALSYYLKALKLAEKYPNEDGFPEITQNNIGTIYLHQQRFSESLPYFFESLKNRSKQDQEGKAVSLSNIGLAYLGLKQYPKALKYLSESLVIQQKIEDQDNMLSTLEGLATVYQKTGDLKKSETYARQSLQIARWLEDKKRMASAYQLLAAGAARQNDYQQAYRHLTQYAQIRDSILNDENTRRIARLEANYQNEKKEVEIALLKEEKSRDVVVRNLIALALLSSLVIGFLAFSRQRLQVRKNQQIHQTQQALKEAEIQNRQVREQQLEQELEFRNKALTTHTLNLIQKNAIMGEIRGTVDLALKSHQPDESSPLFRRLIKLIDYSFNLDQDWDEFKRYFEGVHKDFFAKLKNRHPELSVGELRLCALIRLNMNLKEVATLLSISPDSVKTARHRLRKKLNLSEENNLTDYLITI